ncbi:MAG TPA: peptidase M23 [Candidatus Tenderia electrophaga]|uniref:Peptidase M23 n=1 Tax=Candidatus Tenderia electrophaga TaxID=1748243 RepID=A0A832J633_9GAMM|nr:peptidase M23 [Candidatus Tenderia electrophaga]
MPKTINMMVGKNLHWLLVLGGTAILLIAIGALPVDAEATRAPDFTASQAVTSTTPAELIIPKQAQHEQETEQLSITPELPGQWQTATIKSGDNLSLLFQRNNLSPQELYKVTSNKIAAKQFKRLFPGDEIKLRIDENKLTELSYEFGLGKSLHMVRNENSFDAEIIERPLEYRTRQASGNIENSLFLSAQAAGLSDKLTMELAGIFGWDIDFALDIRQGDNFAVIYEEVFLDGEKVRDGNIIAATFSNRGKSFQAIRYTDSNKHTDYYSADGRSMRKAFLRTPVDFSRISSRFNLKRKHPVLNRIRAHKGVDYAAKRGTPIKATGDGKIVHRGKKGGYGNTVIIQHGSTYSTLYAHMSNYARGIRSGSRVKQGQTIGYVGSSGLATGPHLHYEFRVNGSVRNPLTVKLPAAQPLPKKFMADFKAQANQLMASLELLNQTNIALASNP